MSVWLVLKLVIAITYFLSVESIFNPVSFFVKESWKNKKPWVADIVLLYTVLSSHNELQTSSSRLVHVQTDI